MAKTRIQFLCRQCGSVHPKWMGKCPDCGAWDALEEYKAPTFDARAAAVAKGPGSEFAASNQTGDLTRAGEALPLDEIDEGDLPRLPCGINEFDRILGGGIVPGSAVLIGGEPGIGKSTLLLQVARELAGKAQRHEGTKARSGGKGKEASSVSPSSLPASTPTSSPSPPVPPSLVLYVPSKKPARQTRMRATRLGAVTSNNLLVLAETNVERIIQQ